MRSLRFLSKLHEIYKWWGYHEPWLQEHVLDHLTTCIFHDTGKNYLNGQRWGRSAAVHVTNRWSTDNPRFIVEHLCASDIKLLTICSCSCCLLKEFTCYLPVSHVTIISIVVARQQTECPNRFKMISEDFTHTSLSANLFCPTVFQLFFI